MTTFQKLAASSSRALLTSLEGRRARLIAGDDDTNSDGNDAEEDIDDDHDEAEVLKRLHPAIVDEVARIGRVIECFAISRSTRKRKFWSTS